jgi:ubiquinone/menaquinone biosynthesis C-methylase UbiE
LKWPLANNIYKTHSYPQLKISANLYEYFEKTGYKNPGDAYDGPFQFGVKTQDHYFDWLNQNPVEQHAFNSVMTLGRTFRGEEWFEFFPVEEKLQTSPGQTLLIDIGGGMGHDIVEFKKRYPQLPGKLVLQDLPQVIDDIKEPLPEGVEAVKYDMYTPQPIKGAKVYYMRTVLHDWPNKQALQVLARIREAMTKDSILLLNENTLPADHVPPYSAELDFTMMEVFASLERTEKQWLELLEEADFKVVNVWEPKNQVVGSNALFEATLK